MGVGTFEQPDFETQTGTVYKTAIDNCFAVLARIGQMFAPHEQASPDMTVRIDAGALLANVTLSEVAAQSTGTITAPTGSNYRIDRVVIDALTGAVSVITGAPGALPRTAPAITTGKLPICQVLLASSTTAITNDLIVDERVLMINPYMKKILQVVNAQTGAVATGATIIPFDNTIPQNIEGNQYLTLNITPLNAASNLLIEVLIIGSCTGGGTLTAALFQDAVVDALCASSAFFVVNDMLQLKLTYYMAAGTTSEISFKVRVGSSTAGSFTLNGIGGVRKLGGVLISSITITEIKP